MLKQDKSRSCLIDYGWVLPLPVDEATQVNKVTIREVYMGVCVGLYYELVDGPVEHRVSSVVYFNW